MSDELKAAMLNCRAATAMILAMGMQAENDVCRLRGEEPLYREESFVKLIDQEGIHWNAVAEVIHR